MSFDEQPDPLSDALAAYDKIKKLCLEIQQERNSALKARDEAMGMSARLREAMENLCPSEPAFEDERMKYVEVQVDPDSLKEFREALSSTQPVADWLAAHEAEVGARILVEAADEAEEEVGSYNGVQFDGGSGSMGFDMGVMSVCEKLRNKAKENTR